MQMWYDDWTKRNVLWLRCELRINLKARSMKMNCDSFFSFSHRTVEFHEKKIYVPLPIKKTIFFCYFPLLHRCFRFISTWRKFDRKSMSNEWWCMKASRHKMSIHSATAFRITLPVPLHVVMSILGYDHRTCAVILPQKHVNWRCIITESDKISFW